ncbi:MAG: ribonuclease P protein component [Granulosicoccus sp.]|jgi:ribonuclease P protein component
MCPADPAVGNPTACQSDHSNPTSEAMTLAVSEGHVFPRSARLLTAADYACVFKKNQRFSDKHWTILVHTDKSISPRLGLAIAKKRAKRAVDRNKIKRIARESFRAHRHQFFGLHLVVMNRDAATSESTLGLRKSIDLLCLKIIAKHAVK